MDKEELIPWINRLNAEPDGKKRNDIVAELCKEKGIKIGDAWKLLKEAGFDPKAIQGNTGRTGTNAEAEAKARAAEEAAKAEAEAKARAEAAAKAETRPAVLRHKTQYPKYRCAGLVLAQKAETYQITAEQSVKLKGDPWVVIEKDNWPK
jgi:pyruvate/2-oxoglutarate dehydrogenase complex dihydrolipoamide acyltransferase (E2) component